MKPGTTTSRYRCRIAGGRCGAIVVACVGLLLGCGGSTPEQERIVTTPTLAPEIDAVLVAHRIAAGESLAVRLLGTVGPSGAYSLKDVPVSRHGKDIYIMPNVRKAKSGNFIQMVIPLDHTLKLALDPGTWNLQVFAKQGTLNETITVESGFEPPSPDTSIELGDVTQIANVKRCSVRLQGTCPDGYVDRIEFRTVQGEHASPWRPAQPYERDGGTLHCLATISWSTQTHVQARAVDGQGTLDASPARAVLR